MILDTADTGWNVLILHDFGRYGGALDPFFSGSESSRLKKTKSATFWLTFFILNLDLFQYYLIRFYFICLKSQPYLVQMLVIKTFFHSFILKVLCLTPHPPPILYPWPAPASRRGAVECDIRANPVRVFSPFLWNQCIYLGWNGLVKVNRTYCIPSYPLVSEN